MLSRQEFSVLYGCLTANKPTQRELAQHTNLSLGSVNAVLARLREGNLLTEDNTPTEAGMEALAPHKVDNAVILAAGLSSRFAPISYEKPKGVLTVRGEVLIERQIRQLQEAGITDIIVVVGYKKEHFFYLADEFGVEIVVNPDYAVRNNNSSIMRVADRLGNTFICSSDDYFVDNPFENYVYDAYYAAVFDEGPTNEYCLFTRGKDKRIYNVTVGGRDAWIMLGHAYWDRAYSAEFVRILNNIYDQPTTADMLWEDIYRTHIESLPMVMREYASDSIWEFDSLAELQEFDPDFMENVNSEIMDNICKVLECSRNDISGIVPIKQGLTNLSFKFSVAGKDYIYRHPGTDAAASINRASETASEAIAKDLGIDSTFIYEDAAAGWKLAHFIDNSTKLDYKNWDQVASALTAIRSLHEAPVDTGFVSDRHTATLHTIELLGARERTTFRDFEDLLGMVEQLNTLALAHGARTCLCHNDFCASNILVHEGGISLIDWEYSGMSDYASDLGVFICCSKSYTYTDALRVLELYFGGKPTNEQLFHCVAYCAVVSFYWFVWALHKDECGESVGEWLYLWYRYTKEYGQRALEMAQELGY